MIKIKEYELQTKMLYDQMTSIWPDNTWYNYTHDRIKGFIYSYSNLFNDGDRILNAGSGGECYDGLKGDFFHVDISDRFIKHLNNSYVASVERLPFEKSFFDIVICVGSVVNYCDILFAISEFNRVLKPGSYLIIEYERSQTGELFLNKQYGASATIQVYHYNNQSNHKLWLYSDSYVDRVLESYFFYTLDFSLFHSISSLGNRFLQNEEKAGHLTKFEPFVFSPFKSFFAHNRIILCRKLK